LIYGGFSIVAKIPIKDELFTEPLEPVEKVCLTGTKCKDCHETFLGKIVGCENCGGRNLETVALSNEGSLYTYTVLYAPLGSRYKGPREPFIPLGIGMVELPEGCRIITPLTVNDPKLLKVNMPMRLIVDTLYVNEEGDEVLSFKFGPK
jgi:uncharacterized protein